MSYNSPINIISQMVDEHIKEVQKQEETAIVAEITRKIGVDVDKDELIRALNYDRQQYEKGFSDGRFSGIAEVKSKLTCLTCSSVESSVLLEQDKYKEFIERKLCEEIAHYLYDNNLVTFKETEVFGGIMIRADVQVYDEREGDEE